MKKIKLCLKGFNKNNPQQPYEYSIFDISYTSKKARNEIIKDTTKWFNGYTEVNETPLNSMPEGCDSLELCIIDIEILGRGNNQIINILNKINSKTINWNNNRISREEWNNRWAIDRNFLPSKGHYNDFCDSVWVSKDDSVDEIFNKYFDAKRGFFAWPTNEKFRIPLNMITDLLNCFFISEEKIREFRNKIIEAVCSGWQIYFDNVSKNKNEWQSY